MNCEWLIVNKINKILMNKKLIIFLIFLILANISCSNDEIIPRPKAQLRLEYPKPEYEKVKMDSLSFDKSNYAVVERIRSNKFNLDYPKMKAKLYLTYYPVNHNLDSLLRDAEKFTYEHTVKADEIIRRDFIDDKHKVYGSINLVTGNAASQIQFHATDSLRHFLNGSLYFYALPNYDSIYPAVKYIQKDVQVLLESLRWKH